MGPDRRISKLSYDTESEKIIGMGFKNLRQIDDCIKEYLNNSIVETSTWGNKQGQLWRLQDLLLAGLGEEFIKRHPYSKEGNEDWVRIFSESLARMKKREVKVGTYKLQD